MIPGYEIVRLVGRGGMGVVYEAVEEALGRTVALKIVAPERAGEPGFRERFITESRLAAAIDHPNVLPVFGAGECDGTLYLAMRFVDGADLRSLGAETLIVSNACGGMHPLWSPGDLMLIADHINLLGDNPLIGPNDDSLGPRFPDMSEPYDATLRALARVVASQHRIVLREGVYVAVTGPNLETRAEYRFLRALGADVVGMSTVPEVIVAVHGGMRVLGISIITDQCLPDALVPATVEHIIAVANGAEPRLTALVRGVLERM